MTRELVPVGDDLHLLDTESGETVALSEAEDDLLGEAIDVIDERRRQLAELRRAVGDEAIRRMDERALWTMQAAGRKLSAPSPAPVAEWDIDLLRKVLGDLVTDKIITEQAMDAACEPIVTWTPRARGLAALEKIPAAASRLALCKRSVAREGRTVRVSR